MEAELIGRVSARPAGKEALCCGPDGAKKLRSERVLLTGRCRASLGR